MFFSRVALFALPALAAAAALPRDSSSQCNEQSSQFCCNNVQAASTMSAAQKDSLLDLFGADLSNAVGQVGLACSPPVVPVGVLGGAVGGAATGCTNQNVCCTNSSANGAVAWNCSPIIINA